MHEDSIARNEFKVFFFTSKFPTKILELELWAHQLICFNDPSHWILSKLICVFVDMELIVTDM